MKALALTIGTITLMVSGCSKANTPTSRVNADKSVLKDQASSKCDPNYSGCVPIASDVDCADGNGNGPAYVKGPVTVIGEDIYQLDRDGDGIGCE